MNWYIVNLKKVWGFYNKKPLILVGVYEGILENTNIRNPNLLRGTYF